MTSTTQDIEKPVIHAAMILEKKRGQVTLLLRRISHEEYRWFEYLNGEERQTGVAGITREEAIRIARSEWANSAFKTYQCGFRYTLPERDEHGMNAFFHQMKASLFSFNGIYFDEESGHNCFVQNPSQEARDLCFELKSKGKL